MNILSSKTKWLGISLVLLAILVIAIGMVFTRTFPNISQPQHEWSLIKAATVGKLESIDKSTVDEKTGIPEDTTKKKKQGEEDPCPT